MVADLLSLIPRALFYGEWIVIGLCIAAVALLILIAVCNPKEE